MPFFIFLILSGVLSYRLAHLQIVESKNYQEQAYAAQQGRVDLDPIRGEILGQDKDRNLVILATNKQWPGAYLVPAKVPAQDIDPMAEKLAEITGLERDLIKARLSKNNDPFEPLKDRLSPAEETSLRALTYPGLAFAGSWARYYPLHNLVSQVLGFVGNTEEGRRGQYGIEGTYDDELKGEPGATQGDRGSKGQIIPFGLMELGEPQSGATVVLTIDPNIAKEAQAIAADLVKEYSAQSASVVVLDPVTGAVRAMESVPNFNPNEYGQADSASLYTNPIIQAAYEPGSIFKPITMAGAIDLGKLTPNSFYEDKGLLVFGGRTIQNFDKQAYGRVNMTTVLEKSLNTGAVFAQQAQGGEAFRHYVEAFGFGEKTGVGINGEAAGDIRNLSTNREINLATASFGQGIAVTSLQVARAFAAIANGGDLVSPYVVERIVRDNDSAYVHTPDVRRKVIAQETSQTLTQMLVSVVERGFDRRAVVPGYKLAGKTGTAQIPNPAGGYYEDVYTHSFVGYGPAEKPKFVIVIKLDQPLGVNFASRSTAPAFAKLAQYLLNYYAIPPTVD